MPHYIALIHKELGSGFGVSFPDLPGIVTAGDTLDEALSLASEVLAFAADDWSGLTGTAFPEPSSLDSLRHDPDFDRAFADGVVAAIPFEAEQRRAA